MHTGNIFQLTTNHAWKQMLIKWYWEVVYQIVPILFATSVAFMPCIFGLILNVTSFVSTLEIG